MIQFLDVYLFTILCMYSIHINVICINVVKTLWSLLGTWIFQCIIINFQVCCTILSFTELSVSKKHWHYFNYWCYYIMFFMYNYVKFHIILMVIKTCSYNKSVQFFYIAEVRLCHEQKVPWNIHVLWIMMCYIVYNAGLSVMPCH